MKTKTNCWAFFGCALLISITYSATSVAEEKARGPRSATVDIRYATVDGLDLHLDLYLPRDSDEPPALIVWIHGGGWRKGSKNRCPYAWLTEHGYAVASVQYRLTDKACFPAQIHDCKGAIRWLRAHAKELGYNADKIGVAGISAGGHLVSLLGTSGDVKELEGEVGGNLDQSSRVQAVIDMCGPSDFTLLMKHLGTAAEKPDGAVALLLGGPLSKKQGLAKLASPAQHVTQDDAPLMIFHGSKDPLVNPRQSEHLRDLYQEEKLEAVLHIIPDGGHVPKQFWDGTRRDMSLKFFDKHVKGN